MLNPVVLKLMDVPTTGWKWEEAEKTPAYLGLNGHLFDKLEDAFSDVKRLWPMSWEERLPLAYSLDSIGQKNTLELFEECQLTKTLRLPNRTVKAATFEGLADSNGLPKQDLIKFHQKIAQSGVGMTTIAYGSVSKGGRSFPTQIVVSRESLPQLKKLTDAVHSANPAACTITNR